MIDRVKLIKKISPNISYNMIKIYFQTPNEKKTHELQIPF